MSKTNLNKILRLLWCAINVARNNEEHIKIMNLLAKMSGGEPIVEWRIISKKKGKSTLDIILKEITKLTPPVQE